MNEYDEYEYTFSSEAGGTTTEFRLDSETSYANVIYFNKSWEYIDYSIELVDCSDDADLQLIVWAQHGGIVGPGISVTKDSPKNSDITDFFKYSNGTDENILGVHMYGADDNPDAYAVFKVTVGPAKTVANCKVTLDKYKYTYTGSVIKANPKVTYNGKTLKKGVDYDVLYGDLFYNNIDAGKGVIVIKGKGEFDCDSTHPGGVAEEFMYKSVDITILKAANPMTVTPKTATVKYSKVKKANQTLLRSKVLTVSKAKGAVTYTKVSGNSKITIAKKTGKVTVKKGLKKGTYKVKVKVKAAGTKNYKASSAKTVTFKVKGS